MWRGVAIAGHGRRAFAEGERSAGCYRIVRAHAIYTPLMLSFYDRLVHCLSDRFAWRCPAERMLELYRHNLSSRHLEAGVGTGFFIDRTDRGAFGQLTLLDIKRYCLAISARRLAGYCPCDARRICWRPSPSISNQLTASGSPMCCIVCQGACRRSSRPSTICGRSCTAARPVRRHYSRLRTQQSGSGSARPL